MEKENIVELNNEIIIQVDDSIDDKMPCETQKSLIDAIIDNEVDKENYPPDNIAQKRKNAN